MAAKRRVAGAARARPQYATHTLPGGLTIACLRKGEADFVYREIFEDRVYMKHGIALPPRARVFDVGANIGLFTLFVKQACPEAEIFAFEPSPVLCDLFRRNIAAYSASVRLFECGLAHADGEARFTFYPGYSILSGFHADADRDGTTLRAALRNQFRARFGDGNEPEDRHLDSLVAELLAERTVTTCPIRTLSGVIAEHGVADIDLLKIDAEKGEHDVLRGITEADWPRVRQVVMEVHDAVGGRLAAVEADLRARGFATSSEVEPQFDNTSIVNVYAVR